MPTLPRNTEAHWKAYDLHIITVGFTHYTTDQKLAVMQALHAIQQHANVIFVPAETGEVEFSFTDELPPLGAARAGIDTEGDRIIGGQIELHEKYSDENLLSDTAQDLIVHEMMHVLGFAHPWADRARWSEAAVEAETRMNWFYDGHGLTETDQKSLTQEFGEPMFDLPPDFWGFLIK